MLPPTPRDFDIHHMSLTQFISTWRIAEKHGISQTRVRQIIARVSQWLAATLRVKTDVEIEQEARLAKHLAADQLRHQIEQLQNFWDGSGDPKYLRQQTRVITALARLGTVPGTIDSLAADATIGPYDPAEPQTPWSEDDPWANSVSSRHTPCAVPPQSTIDSPPPPPAASPTPSDLALNPDPRTLNPSTPPPPGDFSASSPTSPSPSSLPSNSSAPNTVPRKTYATTDTYNQQMLAGLKTMEQRLLTLIASTSSDDSDRLTSLHNTLTEVRDSVSHYESLLPSPPVTQLEIKPTISGARMTAPPSGSLAGSFNGQNQTESQKRPQASGV